MTQSKRKTLLECGMCADLVFCGISLLLTAPLRGDPLWNSDTLLLHHPLRTMLMTLVLGICWHFSLVASGAYRSYRTAPLRQQIVVLFRGTGLVALSAFAWLFAAGWNATIAPRPLVLRVALFWTVSFFSLLVTRLCARLAMRMLRRRGRNLRHIVLVGSNRRAVALADRLVGNSDLGYRLAGFVDETWHFDRAPEHYKRLLLGNTDSLRELLRNTVIDEVIIALPIASCYQLTERIIGWCHQQGIVVRCDGSLFDIAVGSTPDGHNAQIITLHDRTPPYWNAGVKRLLDVMVSFTVLSILLPLLVAVAIAIKLNSPGPAFFLQERLGVGKRRFKVVKFRTMVTHAERLMGEVEHLNQSQGPTFKLDRDPRITPIGAFLRKTSIDEVPQFFNVLLGDMSLVGPRPLPLRDYHGFSEDWHRRRFSVKPGITCLWQVTGRSSIGFERWMELDMDYIDRWSLGLDFKILLKTIPAVLRGSGAM